MVKLLLGIILILVALIILLISLGVKLIKWLAIKLVSFLTKNFPKILTGFIGFIFGRLIK